MDTDILERFRRLAATLSTEQRAMLAAIFRLILDCQKCIASHDRLSEVTPDQPPRDVEHFRVAIHRLGKLAPLVATGEMGGREFSRAMGELIEYIETETANQ